MATNPGFGGMAFALSAMGEHINKLVNVTIYYPEKVPSFWEYICGQTKHIKVDIQVSDIPETMRGDYINDRQFKIDFQEQLNQIWRQKDQQLSQYKQNVSVDTVNISKSAQTKQEG